MANTGDAGTDMSSDGEMNMKQERESSGASDTTAVAEPTAPPPVENKPPAPVEGGYGWVCVFGVFLINAHTWGLNSSYGIFLAYYLANDTFKGASTLEYAFVGGLSISSALLVSPLATILTKLYGIRTTLLLGVFFETVSFIAASFAKEIWQLFLSQGICFGVGMGLLFVGSVGVIPQWFQKRRGLANAIGSAGSGIGGLVYNLAVQAMIDNISLAWAFRICGILCFVANLTAALIIKDRNKATGSTLLPFDLSLLKRPNFLLVLGWGFFSMLGLIVLLFSLPNYALSIGLSPAQGAIVGAMLNLGQGVGRPAVGFASDKAGKINMAGFFTFFTGLVCLVVWIFAKDYGVLIFFALISGMVCGTFWATIAPVAAEVLGLKNLASGISITLLFLVMPVTFSEPIALELRTLTGDQYLHAQVFTGFMYIAGSLCMWILRARKLGEMETAVAEKSLQDSNGSEPMHQGPRSSFAKRLIQWKKV